MGEMREKAVHYHKHGFNCSQCILKAAEAVYRTPVSKNSLAMCTGINTGFGVSGMCSVVIAGIMVFGLLFDENTVKAMRMRLISEFEEKYGFLDCGRLKNRMPGDYCDGLIGDTAEMIERIIESA